MEKKIEEQATELVREKIRQWTREYQKAYQEEFKEYIPLNKITEHQLLAWLAVNELYKEFKESKS